ncbi:hypothetical protein [Salinicoccus carnicancri]|uniref:hypothetical protein n=1 Tax=Salinicoccus carnicancri TaxID=558170 RepID=UPI0002EE72DC|nr:hypothetical protein [Salinicoccus carnicancri]
MDQKQHTVTDRKIEQEVRNTATGDLIRQIGAILLALSSFLAVMGYSFEWLTPDSINALLVVLYAVAGFGYTAFEIYKNHFAGVKAQEQAKALKKQGLKK